MASRIACNVAGLVRACWQWPAFYGVLILLGSFQLAWSLVSFVIRHLVSKERGHRIGRRFISLLFR